MPSKEDPSYKRYSFRRLFRPHMAHAFRQTQALTRRSGSRRAKSAILSEMAARPGDDIRHKTLANRSSDVIQLPRATRVPQPQQLPARCGPNSLLRCMHHVPPGTACSEAELLDHLRSHQVVEYGLPQASRRRRDTNVGMRGTL